MDVVGVMAAYLPVVRVCTALSTRGGKCHNFLDFVFIFCVLLFLRRYTMEAKYS